MNLRKALLFSALCIVGTLFVAATPASSGNIQEFLFLDIAPTGSLHQNPGDEIWVNMYFKNQSVMKDVWTTDGVLLGFRPDFEDPEPQYTHRLDLPGKDMGQTTDGYIKNFAWGTLAIDTGNTIVLFDGNAEAGAALYIKRLEGAVILGSVVTNIIGNGFNIYYDPIAMPELGGRTLALGGTAGGSLMANTPQTTPVPLPSTLLLIGPALAGLGVLRSRLKP